jgi:hypothetical protein
VSDSEWNRYLQRKAEEKQRKEQLRKRAEEQADEYERRAENAHKATLLAKHQRKFSCCICGISSSGPATETQGGWDYPYEVTLWDTPASLGLCHYCGRWVHTWGDCGRKTYDSDTGSTVICRDCRKKIDEGKTLKKKRRFR